MLNFFNGLVLVKVMVLLLFQNFVALIKKRNCCYITYGLGFGKVTIYHQNGVKYGRYHVQSRKNCFRYMLFNGNLVLTKNDRFTG
jgi:hypothetical protein